MLVVMAVNVTFIVADQAGDRQAGGIGACPPARCRRPQHGFTLVELLVVIGIIAVLVAILLPALNRARAQANLITCASQMRQVAQYYFLYAQDNNGWFPAVRGINDQNPGGYPCDISISGTFTVQAYEQGCSIQSMTLNSYNTWVVTYSPAPKIQAVWTCPCDTYGSSQLYDTNLTIASSYYPNLAAFNAGWPYPVVNGLVAPTDNCDQYQCIKPNRIHSKVVPNGMANIIMLAEGIYCSASCMVEYKGAPASYYMFYTDPHGFAGRCSDYVHWSNPGLDDNLVFRHFADYSVANAAYFDGHVDSINYHDLPGAYVSLNINTPYDR